MFAVATAATFLAGRGEGWLLFLVVFLGGGWLPTWVDAAPR